jgi:hypothetical protein
MLDFFIVTSLTLVHVMNGNKLWQASAVFGQCTDLGRTWMDETLVPDL